MIVNMAFITVKPDKVDKFIEVSVSNHNHSRLELGNIRFDVLQSRDDPTKFTLYEAFTNEAAVAFHKTTDHYKRWAEAMEECMAEPRTRMSTTAIAFD